MYEITEEDYETNMLKVKSATLPYSTPINIWKLKYTMMETLAV